MADQTFPIPGSLDAAPSRGAALLEWLHSWVVTVDHKKLGILYVVYALFFLLVGGAEALAMRIQLAVPNNHFLSPELYNEFFTMHGTTMVFLVGMPILFGFANYLVPLMIGARDMAFPRLNAFSFWMTAFGGLLLYFSFIGGFGLYGMGSAPDVGWWAYAPLTAKAFSPGHNTDYWALALIVSGFGTLGTAINIVATSVLDALPRHDALPHATLRVADGCGQRPHAHHHHAAHRRADHADSSIAISAAISSTRRPAVRPVVWMHFFWIFGHPEVYVLVLPAFGIASEVIPVFSRKAIFGYPAMVAASVGIAFVSVSVWAHHMFTVGMTSVSNAFFVLSTMMVGIPTGIKIFNWVATMWGGKIRFATPMLFCTAFLFQFLIAGLTGIMLSVAPWDWQLHNSYFVIAHFHYTLTGVIRLLHLCRDLLLVSQSDRPHVERKARQVAFLAFLHRLPSHV